MCQVPGIGSLFGAVARQPNPTTEVGLLSFAPGHNLLATKAPKSPGQRSALWTRFRTAETIFLSTLAASRAGAKLGLVERGRADKGKEGR
jgi:hypothetical protein